MTSPLLIAALTVGVMVLGIWLGRRISPNSRARRGGASVAKDDALNHIFVFRERGLEATPESLAGGLGLLSGPSGISPAAWNGPAGFFCRRAGCRQRRPVSSGSNKSCAPTGFG